MDKNGKSSLMSGKLHDHHASIRKLVKDKLKNGATHTDIALELLSKEDVKIRINPKILTPDAVIANFVAEKPKIALKHSDVLSEASRMNYSIDGSNYKSYAIWALISSHLFYPEITGNHIVRTNSMDETKPILKKLYKDMERLLKSEDGKHVKTISQFTDMVAKQTAEIRAMINEEKDRVIKHKLSRNPDNTLNMLHSSGCRVIALNENETIDPFILTIAANSSFEKVFIVTKKNNGRLKVSLRAVKGKLGANLYRVLNEEERKARAGSEQIDEWNGSASAGGSPLDGTRINFDRLAMIISKHS